MRSFRLFLRSKLFTLRWPTWIIAIALTVAITLIVVPGEPLYQSTLDYSPVAARLAPYLRPVGMFWPTPASPLPWSPREYSHGWPLEWLRRGKGYGGPDWPAVGRSAQPLLYYSRPAYPVSWSAADAWPVSSDAREFHPGALGIDLLVAGVIVVVVALLVERRLRRGRSKLGFRLSDLVVLILLVSLGLGWWRWHVQAQRHELASLNGHGGWRIVEGHFWEEANVGIWNGGGISAGYRGPRWLSKLLGSQLVIRCCQHVTFVSVGVDTGASARLPDFSGLPWLETVELRGEDGRFDSSVVAGALKEAKGLKQVRFGRLLVFREDLEVLASLPTVESIEVGLAKITQAELIGLRRDFPDIQFIESESIQLPSDLDVSAARLDCMDSNAYDYQRDTIDLTRINLDAETLAQLRPFASTVGELRFGPGIDSRDVLRYVEGFPELKCLVLYQGELTSVELLEWIRSQEGVEQYVDLLNARFTPEEIDQIERTCEAMCKHGEGKVSTEVWIAAYEGDGVDEDALRGTPPKPDNPSEESLPADPADDPFFGF